MGDRYVVALDRLRARWSVRGTATAPDAALLCSAQRDGEAMQWIVGASVTLAEPGARLAAPLPAGGDTAVEPNSRDWVRPEQRSPGDVARATADLAACCAILDAHLAAKPFIRGDYRLVDTHLVAVVDWISTMACALAPHASLAAWPTRCAER